MFLDVRSNADSPLSCLGKLSVIYPTLSVSQVGAEVQALVFHLVLLGAFAPCWGSVAHVQPGSGGVLGCLMASVQPLVQVILKCLFT